MATNFPTSLDSLTNPTSTDALNNPSHADQHANVNDAVEALEAKVGVNGSAVTTSLDYKVTNGVMSSLNVDSGVLVVDATNNRVGVNVSSPTTALDVTGTALVRVASTQDGVALAGRAGGTSSYEVTLTPTTLTADRTLTLPNVTGTAITTGNLTDITSTGTLSSLTVTGDVAVDTNTLKVDSTNNRVGIVTTSPAYPLDVTGTAQATAFLQGTDYLTPYTGFRNAIINGDFRINQRAWSSSTATGTYGFDRWKQVNSGGTVTMSSQSFTVGSPAATGYEAATFCRVVTASQSATGDYAIFSQVIEDVRTFANSTITISFWAKAASGTPKVALEFQQGFGSGGSPSADVNTYGGQATLSTSWARYSLTATVPNINGKTIGTTANTSFLGIQLWVSGGSTFNSRTGSLGLQNNTFDFWGVQVERGSVATPFEQRPIGAELALCQRYYWLIAPPSSGYGKPASGLSANATTVQACGPIWHPVEMRSAPTVGFTFSSNNLTAYDGTEVNATAFADASPWTTTNLTTFNLTTNTGLTANRTAHILHRVGNITFSSEF